MVLDAGGQVPGAVVLVEAGSDFKWQSASRADSGLSRIFPIRDQSSNVIVGGFLASLESKTLAFDSGVDSDLAEAQHEGALAMAVSLDLLSRMPEPFWLAAVIPANGMFSARGFFRTLATLLPTDLTEIRQRVGKRLILVHKIDPRVSEPSAELLRSLAQWHTIGSMWSELQVGVMRSPSAHSWQRVFAGAPLVSGIDTDLNLQRQWLFLSRGLSALSIPVVAMGVQTVSECSWLQRHGCEAIADTRGLCSAEEFLQQLKA